MTFEFLAGRTLSASSDVHLVAALRHVTNDILPSPTIEDFIDELAQFVRTQAGQPVRTRSVQDFLFDLQLYGLLKPIGDPWDDYSLETVRVGLLGPMTPTGWHHQLIWSSTLPHVVSTNAKGACLYRCLTLAELKQPNTQARWVREHLTSLLLYR